MALKLLVTGTKGQIATALARFTCPDGAIEVVTAGRPQLDLVRPETVATTIRRTQPDIVINAAAYTAVNRAEGDREGAFAVNADGAGVVAAAANRIGVPIIHISTDYVFDGNKTTPYAEKDPTGPLSVYGASKLAGEEAVAAANPRHVILRTSWIYSGSGRNFLVSVLRLARERHALRIIADQHGTPTHADDLAKGIVAVARSLATAENAFGLFHMSACGETTWCGFAEAIFAESASLGGPSVSVEPISTVDYPTAARRPKNSRLDCTKLVGHHGVRLREWREGITACVAEALATDGD